MYKKFVQYYDALYHFKDYDAETERLVTIIQTHHGLAASLLDVACGTGKHLERLRSSFDVEGLDINPEFLALARHRLPRTPLHQKDMMKFDLGKTFDVVTCLFSSVTCVQTVENLNRTVQTFARHLAPGGLLLIEPLYPPESFWEGHISMNTADQPDLKIVWMYVNERIDRIARFRNHFMVGTPKGIETFVEVHNVGLFTDTDYCNAFAAAGLDVTFDKKGLGKRGLYIAKRMS